MMNLLLTGLPDSIKVKNKVHKVHSDYKTGVKIILAMEDRNLTDREKQFVLVNLLYESIPEDFSEAVLKGIKFINCGSEDFGGGNKSLSSRLYSFEHDAKYIYSGIDKVLRGKLSRGEFVHWWEFVMAFMELPEDCTMSKILYFRTQYAKNKLTKEERKIYTENRDLFELPQELTADEKTALDEFMGLLGK